MSWPPPNDLPYPNKRARHNEPPQTQDESFQMHSWPHTTAGQSITPLAPLMTTPQHLHSSSGLLSPPSNTVGENVSRQIPPFQPWDGRQHMTTSASYQWAEAQSVHFAALGNTGPSQDGHTAYTKYLVEATRGYEQSQLFNGVQGEFGAALGPQLFNFGVSTLDTNQNTSNSQFGPLTLTCPSFDLSTRQPHEHMVVPPVWSAGSQILNPLPDRIHHETIEIESSAEPPSEKSDIVCFGMFVKIPGTCKRPDMANSSSYPVRLQAPDSFVGTNTTDIQGEVSPDYTFLTIALLGESDLDLQVTCTITTEPIKLLNSGKQLRVAGLASQCSLDIILYGPSELSDELCTFIEENNQQLEISHKLYLQDPVGCDRNVPYQNPQRLPPLDPENVQSTFDLANKRQSLVELEQIEPRPELLDLLDSQDDLPETPQAPSINTPLERHQKQALTFMLRRETGWAFDGTRPDIWEAADTGGGRHCFMNRVSNTSQMDEPPEFYGGVIADPMGLGKTLTMIALIASDTYHQPDDDTGMQSGVLREDSCGLTLVVVPPPLLGSWEEQLISHVTTGMLPWRLHHGKSRIADLWDLRNTALVLTTYHTVSNEWRSDSGRETSILFTSRWRRVVLDEAHFIRNSESQMSQAICALDAVSRWAVTGTPIQNRLSDLAALLKFLNVYPYSEKRVFDADISHLWKIGKSDEAIKRLKRLAGCLLLRRPKSTIQLPPKRDLACHVQFQPLERNLYDQIRDRVIARFDEALLSSTDGSKNVSFASILQQIEAMRMVCNLGLLYPNRHETSNKTGKLPDKENWKEDAQGAFGLRLEVGEIRCHYCTDVLDAACHPHGILGQRHLFAQCLRLICSNCISHPAASTHILTCGCQPPCPMALVSASPSSLEEPSQAISVQNLPGSKYLPTKVQALIEDFRALPGDVKCVVFSTWRMTLDVVEAGLSRAGIASLRFDGKVPQKERQGAVERFRNDASIRVLLLTLSCGAVGLTLTTASRAYLMEPHWNPTLEDQALARIHRIGQRREVTTVRFYVKDSFEENVIKNQQSKRDLAAILLAPNDAAMDPMTRLEASNALLELACYY